jgi:PAS domain S-box-containing protein
MSHHEPVDRSVTEPAEHRVLLALAGDHDRELVADRLPDRYSIHEGGGPAEVDEFDLSIVDAQKYRDVEETLAERKRLADAYLPVLLLVEDRERAREAAWLVETLGGTVDDVLVTPVPPHEFEARVEALLRVRRQSLELALFRRAMDEATIGISITDPSLPDNPLVYVNEGFCRVTGYDREDVLGRNCRLLQGPETREKPVADLRAAIDAEEPTSVEIRNYRADGEPFWNNLTIAHVRDRPGEVTHFLGFQRDVTERTELSTDLRTERELLERVFETSPVGIVVVEPDGTIVRGNEAAERELGLERSEITSRTYDDPDWEAVDLDGDPLPEAELPAARVLSTGEPVADYRHGIRVDGQTRWMSVNAAPMTDADGDIEAVVTAVQNVTERLERERELKRDSTVLETIDDGVWIVDDDRRVSFINRTVTSYLPISAADIVGRPLAEFRYLFENEAGYDRYVAAIEDLFEERRSTASLDLTLSMPDDTLIANFRLAPLTDDDGVTGVVAVTNDITERVQRERELERYETIVQTTSDPIYVLDPDGIITRVNDAMVEKSGYSRDELLGSHASLLADEATVDEAESHIRHLLESDRDRTRFEATMEFKDGTAREFATSLAILRADDEFLGTIIVAHDITDLRQNQWRLSVLDRVLRHNMRNRMNVILGYAREITDTADDDIARLGAAIEENAADLLGLSESAREFEPVITGDAQPTTAMDATEVVADAVAETSNVNPDASVSVDCAESAPIRGHETFRLAIGEIIQNAIEHNPHDPPTVDVVVRTVDDRVEISVADDGPGIADIEQRALETGVESPLEHTQGLGLWLVNWAVRSVDGDLHIEDNEPHGTVVTITVPRAER